MLLPLIALQYHEVKINLELRPIDEVLFAVNQLDCSPALTAGTSVKATAAYQQSLVAASLYVDYVFLDTDERRRMAQNPHEYLIEQLQFTGDESVGSSSNKIKLNFNHPCKEVVFVVQPDKNVNYCASLECGTVLNNALGAQPFNYTDAVDALPNALLAYSGVNAARGQNGVITTSGLFEDPAAGDVSNASQWADVQSVASAFPETGAQMPTGTTTLVSLMQVLTFLLRPRLTLHCWGQNPVVTAKLQLNGQDRFSEREGSYFDVVQPFQHHTRNPDTGINVYSFALRPEEHQPSGTCNMSRIDNATLQLVLSSAAIGGDDTAKVRVYATNYNVLRIMSGMGGLAYSN